MFMLCGDVNAHTRDVNDVVSHINNICVKSTIDTITNSYGDSFFEFHKDSRMGMLNG